MRIRMRILIFRIPGPDFYLMRLRMRIQILASNKFQIKAQTFEKELKQAHNPCILACHLQIDANPVPDPAYHFDAAPDPDFI
jgi:hypothetical protein